MSRPGLGLRLVERPREVEASLWRRLRYENELACREMLFNRYLRFARALASREFARRPAYGLERLDFVQLACGGLLEAIDRYDPNKGAPFEFFAKHRIRGAIADGLAKSSEGGAQYSFRRRSEMERLRSLAPNTSENADFVSELSDLTATLAIGLIAEQAAPPEGARASGYESRDWRDIELSVLAEIERLPDKEKSVMHQHYLNNLPFKEIADLLGVSKGRVSQLHRAALARVREQLRRAE